MLLRRQPVQLSTLLTLIVAVFAISDAVFAAEPFMPTAVGTRWLYSSGKVAVEERILSVDDIDGEKCLRIETLVNSMPLAFEHIAIRTDGLYRVTVGGEKVDPPVCFLKFSGSGEEKWKIQSTVGGENVAGNFVAGKTLVSVPAGRYTAVTSKGTKFKVPNGELEFTYCYAQGVGKVKQVVKLGENSTELVLEALVLPDAEESPK
ncbi:hypothetical protein [Planctomicrobium sp. SH527]|uniref:hypothetical protein n=1 Tax=Planctomicrobium sp. SH527 TaxID=3448123 RepID=UPI003F5C1F39